MKDTEPQSKRIKRLDWGRSKKTVRLACVLASSQVKSIYKH